MFLSIFDIQPRRVSWGDNINWRRCWGEEIEAQLPWETTQFQALMIDNVWTHISGCNHLSGDSTGGRPTFGDSTL